MPMADRGRHGQDEEPPRGRALVVVPPRRRLSPSGFRAASIAPRTPFYFLRAEGPPSPPKNSHFGQERQGLRADWPTTGAQRFMPTKSEPEKFASLFSVATACAHSADAILCCLDVPTRVALLTDVALVDARNRQRVSRSRKDVVQRAEPVSLS